MQKSTVDRVLTTVENLLAAAPFAVVAVVAFVNVVSRYFLNASLAFTSELTVSLAVWMVMMGAVIALREGGHLGFSALHDAARGPVRGVMTVLITAAIVAFFVVLLFFGIDLAALQAWSGRSTPSIGLPQWLFTAALPVGAVLGVYRAVQAGRAGFRRSTVEALPSEEADR
ncbi:TRAP-type C4-dicarboxylate transport system, small permease component [Prauserella sp. Am3]|nr:TRAP-type C4-dicarboxylate transport system, small permease component [Prauserella sp. Am3]